MSYLATFGLTFLALIAILCILTAAWRLATIVYDRTNNLLLGVVVWLLLFAFPIAYAIWRHP